MERRCSRSATARRCCARHLPFAIGTDAINGWLLCFHQALQETVYDGELRDFIWSRIEPLALHMRNQTALPVRWRH